ncbi:Z1 domain-containing protein [Limosilactobacillus reuteri]|uniref:Z1 domain-containing protein n=1 Tax=Limosilactobacillus reuteri TaxID=1598 RepID=UPI003991DEFF
MLTTKLDIIKDYYDNQKKKGKKTSWNDMLSESDYQVIKGIWESINGPLTYEEYRELISKQAEREKISRVTVFGEDTNNTAVKPTGTYSSWKQYKSKLIDQDHWSDISVKNIEESAFNTLKYLTMDAKTGPHKGLVVGNIQSGKTANISALIAMAADNGFNMFIVLSGMIENLRQQNAKRIINDLQADGQGDNHWTNLDNPSIKRGPTTYELKLKPDSKEKYLIVSLKNASRIDALHNWLKQDPNKQRQMKVLFIDDEADQASINTRDVNSDERTSINNLILNIVEADNFGAMNYVAYTATPFANVLNETGERTLYPKNFISLLEPGENYIGPTRIFGLGDPDYQKGMQDIINEIPQKESKEIQEAQRDGVAFKAPESMRKAIDWFLIATAAMRSQNYKKPISMMIHTDFHKQAHSLVEKSVQHYLKELQQKYQENPKYVIKKLHEEYKMGRNELSKETFKKVMTDYSGDVKDYPEWDEVKDELISLLSIPKGKFVHHIKMTSDGEKVYGNGIHLCVDNSSFNDLNDEHIRLIYPDGNQLKKCEKAPAFIVIGGNTLSRGLTIEGLVSTFFLRRTNQADTLMQMARWFGYRQGYELMPRIWMDQEAEERYEFLTEMNEDMREKLMEYADTDLTPIQSAPRILQSPSYVNVRITANNKMQESRPTDFNFEGLNHQIILYKNKEKSMRNNLRNTKTFLEELGEYEVNGAHMVWRRVKNQKVKEYLGSYQGVELDKQLASMPHILEWLSENGENFPNWNVILAGRGDGVHDAYNNEWNINGKTVDAVQRSKTDKSTNEIIDIHALRSPRDLLADISDASDAPESVKKSNMGAITRYRRQKGMSNIPQLLIYRIDKNSRASEGAKTRQDLNTPYDLIGLNIWLPESEKRIPNKNTIEYVAVTIKDYDQPLNSGVEVDEETSGEE